MSSTKTIPAIASNEYEFQWGREVLFFSNGRADGDVVRHCRRELSDPC